MTNGQWLALGLVLVLLGLEIVRNKNLSSWFTSVWAQFNNGLNNAGK